MLPRLRLLLCAAHARVPQLRQRHRLRPQDRRQAQRRRRLLREAFERPSWKANSSSSAATPIATSRSRPPTTDPRLPRGVRRVPQSGAHHHQGAAHRARPRRARPGSTTRPRCGVTISIPFWNETNARAIEPYVATPKRRMTTVRAPRPTRASAVSVNVAPIIPGLSDEDIGAILEAARDAGRQVARR